MLWNSSKLYFKNALKLSKAPPNPKTIKHEIKLSLISSFIYAAPTAVVLELWKEGGTAIYSTAPADIIGWLWVASKHDNLLTRSRCMVLLDTQVNAHPQVF